MLLSGAYFFCILFAYSLISPYRDEMGMRKLESLPWLWTGTLAATLVAAFLYAVLVSRLPRRWFVPIAYLFFAACLAGFYALFLTVAPAEHAWIGYSFYIWTSVFSLFNTAIFWGLTTDLYTSEQGKRLFGAIGIGGTLGTISGSSVPSFLVRGFDIGRSHVHIPAVQLLPISMVVLGVAVVLALRLLARLGDAPQAGGRAREPGGRPWSGVAIIARSPYLLGLCGYMLLFSVTSTFLTYLQLDIIAHSSSESDKRVAAQATVTLWANIVTLTTQVFFTGQILTRLGLLFGLLLLPVVTGGGFLALAAAGTPLMVLVVAAGRRGLHYAVDRPTREVLYTVLGPEEKYKSKSFIDTFVYRTGDQIGIWTSSGLKQAGFALAALASMAAALSLLWIGVGAALNAMNRRIARRDGGVGRGD